MQVYWGAAKWQLGFTPEKRMNEERRKASACLQPGTNAKSPGSMGVSNPWSCSSSRCDMSRVQVEATVAERAWGPLPKCEGVICQLQALGWGGGQAMADSWMCGTKLGAPHCTEALCELIWLAFLRLALAAKAPISSFKRRINNQQGGWQPGFIL